MKTPDYPIVEHKVLPPAPRRGLFGLLGPSRDPAELPAASASQVLVYRSGGEFHMDRGGLAKDDPVVVRADHVSVVDMARDVSVTVPMTIPSTDDVGFELRAGFACTVVDAVTVVREGRARATDFLTDYLNRYDRLSQFSQGLPLSAINQVREMVQSQIKAFVDLVPPQIDGMRITYLGTDVLTPTALSERREEMRTTRQQHESAKTRTENEHELHAMVTAHTKAIMGELSEAIQNDTINVVMMALAKEELSSTQVIQRISAERDQAIQREEQRLEAERADWRLRDAEKREDMLRHQTWSREDERARMEMRYQIAKTAIENNYMDGSLSTAEVVNFVDPALRPGAEQAIAEGVTTVEEADTLVVDDDAAPGAGGGGTGRDVSGNGGRPPVFRPTPVSEDDHDA
ncbi:hypothetical protein SUDANB121_02946 [Nocardiopsis dassonvillei]|uniref:hypothetical protein n=1 Tax=Nocardiopsis dassonvillei TaxID=2014 RepID=UPI003F579B38